MIGIMAHQKEKIGKILLLFGLQLSISGCHLGPDYHVPSIQVTSEWKNNVPIVEEIPFTNFWWDVFQDEYLTNLIWKGIENSPNLVAAMQRVTESRAVAQVNLAALSPQATINPSYSDLGELFLLNLPSNTIIPGIAPLTKPFRVHLFQYVLPLNLSYEVDLWGKLQGRYNSALFAAQAQEEAYHASLLTLTTDIASNYFQLRAIDTELENLQNTIDLQKKLNDLTQSRFEKGLSNALDAASSTQELYTNEASYFDALRQRGLLENIIATLIGVSASTFCIPHSPLVDLPPEIPAGVPSDVLLQRPDIAQTERQMASEHALIGVAYSAYLPSLSLTGAVGFLSPDFKQFLEWISRYWMIGANINQMVFDGGRNDANLLDAWARFAEASLDYRQQILIAFQEVENALNNIENQKKQYDRLLIAVNAAEKRFKLTNNRNRQGLVNTFDVIDSERAQLNLQLSTSNLLGQRYVSTVQLIKALGGSWCIPN
jgi:outer membrane protein, multidrug efflux system